MPHLRARMSMLDSPTYLAGDEFIYVKARCRSAPMIATRRPTGRRPRITPSDVAHHQMVVECRDVGLAVAGCRWLRPPVSVAGLR